MRMRLADSISNKSHVSKWWTTSRTSYDRAIPEDAVFKSHVHIFMLKEISERAV